ncbi:MAG TPA: hypothetical protein VIK34_02290 [Clostridiaceae bacterium]
MDIQFDPNNNIIKLLLRGMVMEDSGKPEDASLIFLKAWSEATVTLKDLLQLIM